MVMIESDKNRRGNEMQGSPLGHKGLHSPGRSQLSSSATVSGEQSPIAYSRQGPGESTPSSKNMVSHSGTTLESPAKEPPLTPGSPSPHGKDSGKAGRPDSPSSQVLVLSDNDDDEEEEIMPW